LRAAFLAIWAVILSVAFMQTAHGLQTDLIGVRAGLEKFPDWTIGLLMAGYYAGYSSAPIAGHFVVGRLGHVRTIMACVFVAGVIIIAHALVVTPIAWAAFRFVSGFALALVYVACESWINARVGNALRGRVFSTYIITQMTTMTLAQYLLSLGNPRTAGPFVFSAVLFALAAVPVYVGRRHAPAAAPPVPLNVLKLLCTSPLGALATALAGTSWAIVGTMGPVYAQRVGFDLKGIALWMGLAMAAGSISQFPFGWLSDVFGRRKVIATMFALGLAASLAGLWAVRQGADANLIVAALVGLCIFPLYTVSVAHVNDAIAQQTRVAAAAGLILLYGLGSMLGALLCGWAMTAMGPLGFYAALAAAMASGAALAAVAR
jgi:MFS family permease